MKRYHVHGTGPDFTWTITVEAESEEQAKEKAMFAFEDDSVYLEFTEIEEA